MRVSDDQIDVILMVDHGNKLALDLRDARAVLELDKILIDTLNNKLNRAEAALEMIKSSAGNKSISLNRVEKEIQEIIGDYYAT